MYELEVTYEGQGFNDLPNIIRQQIELIYTRHIESFAEEINAHGGKVVFSVSDDYESLDIKFIDLPDKLVDRIMETLDQ
ncbi:hypothetical protein [Tellurirhabdus bombi]|uniref:hypothetical protein n=1 Tax=Tellurirhabdus bombi TaxID=2907205 RepID=UPI001F30EAB0|nr:hypothetical protein [Tellurirhabdus bombi]